MLIEHVRKNKNESAKGSMKNDLHRMHFAKVFCHNVHDGERKAGKYDKEYASCNYFHN